MEKRRAKILGIIVVLVAFLLGSINSIAATGLNVTDTDPSTYVIVVMLMLFLLIIFSAKEDLDFKFEKENLVYGVVIFIIYVLLLSYSRVALSFVFQSYRIDALLFPLLLVSLIVLIFGVKGIMKMKQVPVYALFASPLLLLPLLSLNEAFANLNAEFVYGIMKLVGIPVTQNGLAIVAPSLASITISTTCVSIGTFVALVMFLLPLAYLYKGRIRSRVLWVASGFGLILLLNVLRMLFVSLVWAYYGIGSAINVFHAFAGQLLFYAVIIIMILLAGRYGMQIEKIKRVDRKDKGTWKIEHVLFIPIALAILFGFVAFVLSLQYSSAVYAPVFFFGNSTISKQLTLGNMVGSLAHANANVTQLGASVVGEMFGLSIDNANESNITYVIGTPVHRPFSGGMVVNYTKMISRGSFILRNGITVTSTVVISQGYAFDVDYFALPYNYSGMYATTSYEVFGLSNSSSRMCDIDSYKVLGISNYIESTIYNMLNLQSGAGDKTLRCYSYYIASER